MHRPGRSYAQAQAARTTQKIAAGHLSQERFAAEKARYRKNRWRFFPMD
jgi:hypothetical protein